MPTTHGLEHRWIEPQEQRYTRPLLLIHGAWHGAWCWEPAMRDFAARGFAVHALSLRGHGESERCAHFNRCGIDAYLQDIDQILARIKPTPVVIAHSLGGFLMQHYLVQRPLPGLVLLCTMPYSGAWRFLWRWVRRHPGAALRSILALNTYHLVGTPALAWEAFFSSALAEQEVAAYARQLGPESLRVGIEMLLRRPQVRRGSTPVLVIGGAADQVFSLEEQRAVAQVYQAPLVTIPRAAHDLMLDPAWPQASELIVQAVQAWMLRCEAEQHTGANLA